MFLILNLPQPSNTDPATNFDPVSDFQRNTGEPIPRIRKALGILWTIGAVKLMANNWPTSASTPNLVDRT